MTIFLEDFEKAEEGYLSKLRTLNKQNEINKKRLDNQCRQRVNNLDIDDTNERKAAVARIRKDYQRKVQISDKKHNAQVQNLKEDYDAKVNRLIQASDPPKPSLLEKLDLAALVEEVDLAELKELQNLFESIDNHELALRRKKMLANVQRLVLLQGQSLDKSIEETKAMLKKFGVKPETVPKSIQRWHDTPNTIRLRNNVRTQDRQTVKLDMPIKQKLYPSWMTLKMVKNTIKFVKHRNQMVERLEKCKAALKKLYVMSEQDLENMEERNADRKHYLHILQSQVSDNYRLAIADIDSLE